MKRAASAVIKDGQKIKTVARNLSVCHMTLYRFVKKLKTGKDNIEVGYKKVRLVFNEEQKKTVSGLFDKMCSYFLWSFARRSSEIGVRMCKEVQCT